jgi:2-polyprenyl-3-methyl-5-hydroxy-6-metoxy-1,4-benzoquinol methylase
MDTGFGSLFQDEITYTTEKFTLDGISFQVRQIERENGQIKGCLSQVQWPGAYPLTEYLSKTYFGGTVEENIKQQKCLELGSGTGILAVYLALKYPFKQLAITDYDQQSLDLIKENLKLNEVTSDKIEVLLLDWVNVRDSWRNCTEEVNKYELLVGSEIIYHKDVVKPLVDTIAFLLQEKGVCLIANHTVRVNKLEEHLVQCCKEQNLLIECKGYIDSENCIKLHQITHNLNQLMP